MNLAYHTHFNEIKWSSGLILLLESTMCYGSYYYDSYYYDNCCCYSNSCYGERHAVVRVIIVVVTT